MTLRRWDRPQHQLQDAPLDFYSGGVPMELRAELESLWRELDVPGTEISSYSEAKRAITILRARVNSRRRMA